MGVANHVARRVAVHLGLRLPVAEGLVVDKEAGEQEDDEEGEATPEGTAKVGPKGLDRGGWMGEFKDGRVGACSTYFRRCGFKDTFFFLRVIIRRRWRRQGRGGGGRLMHRGLSLDMLGGGGRLMHRVLSLDMLFFLLLLLLLLFLLLLLRLLLLRLLLLLLLLLVLLIVRGRGGLYRGLRGRDERAGGTSAGASCRRRGGGLGALAGGLEKATTAGTKGRGRRGLAGTSGGFLSLGGWFRGRTGRLRCRSADTMNGRARRGLASTLDEASWLTPRPLVHGGARLLDLGLVLELLPVRRTLVVLLAGHGAPLVLCVCECMDGVDGKKGVEGCASWKRAHHLSKGVGSEAHHQRATPGKRTGGNREGCVGLWKGPRGTKGKQQPHQRDRGHVLHTSPQACSPPPVVLHTAPGSPCPSSCGSMGIGSPTIALPCFVLP